MVWGETGFDNGFDLVVVRFSLYNFRRWFSIVGPMGWCFFVRAEEGVVEDWVDSP